MLKNTEEKSNKIYYRSREQIEIERRKTDSEKKRISSSFFMIATRRRQSERPVEEHGWLIILGTEWRKQLWFLNVPAALSRR